MIARGAASALLVGALLLGTTGCSFFATQATLIQYEPSDGVAAHVGDIKFRNVLAITSDGSELSIVFTAINSGDTDEFVTLQYVAENGDKDDVEFFIAAHSSKSIGDPSRDEETVILTGTDATVGGLFSVYAQYGTHQGDEMLVPVLDGSLQEYSTLVPTGTPTTTPTPVVVPTPTATSTTD